MHPYGHLEGFAHSSFAGDLDGHKPISGFIFLSGATVISWASKLQPLAALSTVAADFISMCLGVKLGLWLLKIAINIGGTPGVVVS